MISDSVIRMVDDECERAEQLHGKIPSIVRGMVILGEEVGEACEQALDTTRPTPKPTQEAHAMKLVDELVQVASTALRIADRVKEGLRE